MARKNTEIQVTVYSVKRARSSVNGNPAYVFVTDRGEFRTESDIVAAYGLENTFTVGVTLDRAATLELTPGGRVCDWRVTP